MKMQPIIRNDINEAFEKSSFPNITIKTKRGIVYSGFPAIEIKFAILESTPRSDLYF
jgi:hypothetical protein